MYQLPPVSLVLDNGATASDDGTDGADSRYIDIVVLPLVRVTNNSHTLRLGFTNLLYNGLKTAIRKHLLYNILTLFP